MCFAVKFSFEKMVVATKKAVVMLKSCVAVDALGRQGY